MKWSGAQLYSNLKTTIGHGNDAAAFAVAVTADDDDDSVYM